MKLLLAYVIMWIIAVLTTGCGISTPGGFVAGTTGFLEQHNRGALIEMHTDDERKQLTGMTRR